MYSGYNLLHLWQVAAIYCAPVASCVIVNLPITQQSQYTQLVFCVPQNTHWHIRYWLSVWTCRCPVLCDMSPPSGQSMRATGELDVLWDPGLDWQPPLWASQGWWAEGLSWDLAHWEQAHRLTHLTQPLPVNQLLPQGKKADLLPQCDSEFTVKTEAKLEASWVSEHSVQSELVKLWRLESAGER